VVSFWLSASLLSSSNTVPEQTPDPAAEITAAAERLQSADPAVRLDAAETLARSEAAAEAAVPLVKACGDNDEQVRDWCVAALEQAGPPPAESLRALADLAADPNPLVAYWAITLLGRLGEAAASAVPVLAGRLEPGQPPEVARRAAWALRRICPPTA